MTIASAENMLTLARRATCRCAQRRRSTAHPERPAVQMKVIVVRRVVVRSQHRIEEAACLAVRVAQEGGVGVPCAPSVAHAHAMAAVDHEACHVERVGGGVLAAALGRRAP